MKTDIPVYNMWLHEDKHTNNKMPNLSDHIWGFPGNNLLIWKLLNEGEQSNTDPTFIVPTLPQDYPIVDEGEFFFRE